MKITIKKNFNDWNYDIYPEGWDEAMIYNLTLEDLKDVRNELNTFIKEKSKALKK